MSYRMQEYLFSGVPLVTNLLIIYMILIVVVFATRYIRTYTYNKRLTFTRDSLKEVRQEINEVIIQGSINKRTMGSEWYSPHSEFERQILTVMSLYNEVAVGVNEGLYDELYVKTILGKEMAGFYKQHYKTTMDSDNDSYYIPLELLLKRWESSDAPVYRQKQGRRRGL